MFSTDFQLDLQYLVINCDPTRPERESCDEFVLFLFHFNDKSVEWFWITVSTTGHNTTPSSAHISSDTITHTTDEWMSDLSARTPGISIISIFKLFHSIIIFW